MTNVLLSFPKSGNHLVRFFIELLSEIPTFGCGQRQPSEIRDRVAMLRGGRTNDIEVYRGKFSKNIPLNISNYNTADVYHKSHNYTDYEESWIGM